MQNMSLNLTDEKYVGGPNLKAKDKVNHPSHYTWLKNLCGIEVIDITRHMGFNLGNVVKDQEIIKTKIPNQSEKRQIWYFLISWDKNQIKFNCK